MIMQKNPPVRSYILYETNVLCNAVIKSSTYHVGLSNAMRLPKSDTVYEYTVWETKARCSVSKTLKALFNAQPQL